MRIDMDALQLVSSRMTGIAYCEDGQEQEMMMQQESQLWELKIHQVWHLRFLMY